MNFTEIGLILMLILFKYSGNAERWWIALFILVTVLALCGCVLQSFELLVAVGVWKIIKDVFCR